MDNAPEQADAAPVETRPITGAQPDARRDAHILLADATELEANGFWEEAAELRASVWTDDELNDDERRAAGLRQARLLLDLERPTEAETVLARLPGPLPSADQRVADLLAARALAALGDADTALARYQTYLDSGGPAASSIRLQIARLQIERNDGAAAIAAYAAVIDDPTASDWDVEAALLELGLLHENRGEYAQAEARYQQLYDVSPWINDDAFALARLGEVRWRQGNATDAREAWGEVVREYPWHPRAAEAYELANSRGVGLGRNAEGLVLYRQFDIRDARDAFSAVLQDSLEPSEEAFARYYLAAIDEDLGEHSTAIVNYLRAASLDPRGPLADDALWWAAGLIERRGYLEIAADLYERLARDYPQSELAGRAAVRPGVLAYERDQLQLAEQRLLAAIPSAWTADTEQRAWLWLGKVRQAAGDERGARDAFERARRIDPAGYGGLRADVGLRGASHVPAATPAGIDPAPPDGQAALGWLSQRAGPEPETPPLASEPLWQAALDLHLAGFGAQARARFTELSAASIGDLWRLYRLAEAMDALGLTRQALETANLLLAGLNAEERMAAPAQILRWAYPLGWPALVAGEAQRANVDQLLVQALIRQESHFDPGAGSSAGALGLTQVIPPTAADIADALADDGFHLDLLFRPERSIVYGTYYLGRQLESFGGAAWIALAAYNGGPGSAERWSGGDYGIDPDLFFERVGFTQTREYLRRVLENYAWYQFIYRGAASPTLLNVGLG